MGNMKTYPSDFVFWGERNYVQGSHIIYGMLDAIKYWRIGTLQHFSASFKGMLQEQGEYLLFRDKEIPISLRSEICFLSEVTTDTGRYSVGLVREQEAVRKRIEDDEESLIAGFKIDADAGIALEERYPADRLITVIIALNKKMHKNLLPVQEFSPWIVARLDLHWQGIRNGTPGTIKICIDKNIAARITKSIILIEDKNVGEIHFNRKMIK